MVAQGAKIRASDYNSLFPLRVRKGLDETVNNVAVVQNDDALVLPAIANRAYRLWLMAVVTTVSATPDWRSGFVLPAGAAFTGNCLAPGTGAASADTTLNYAGFVNVSGTFNVPRGLVGGSNLVYLWEGELVMGGTAGNIQFQWSQNTATAENTTVKAGSTFHLTPLL